MSRNAWKIFEISMPLVTQMARAFDASDAPKTDEGARLGCRMNAEPVVDEGVGAVVKGR